MNFLADTLDSAEYRLVSQFYGTRTAERSGIPLMQHIDEGLKILAKIEAGGLTMRAWCLHPLLQRDQDLSAQWLDVYRYCGPAEVLLAMEYRNIANQFLSNKIIKVPLGDGTFSYSVGQEIVLSPLGQVNQMLVADKVQNRKDFEKYHRGTHQRSAELEYYFRVWLEKLGISDSRYASLIQDLE